jgi:hypothetical protein
LTPLTQGDVLAITAEAGANDRKQPALTAERKTKIGLVRPFLAPAEPIRAVASLGEKESNASIVIQI